MTRRLAPLGVGFALLLSSGPAVADDEAAACGGPGHPGIVLEGRGLDPKVRAAIAEQLRAALAGRSFDLCDRSAGAGAVATLDVSGLARPDGTSDNGSASPTAVAVTLSVRDEVTDKRVSRDIDLRRIPDDARALLIAQAADELLRASWAELLVADAPKPRREIPPEIVRAVPAPEAPPPAPAPPRAPILELGVSGAFEHFGSGHTQFGPDVAVGVFPFERIGAIARAGFRSAQRSEAAIGSVDPSSIVGGLAVVAGVLPRAGRFGLDAGAELFVTRVHYEAEAQPGSRARSESGTAADVSAVARGWLVFAPRLRATLGLALGAPLHSVRAVAAESTIASISGVLLGAQLGVAGAW